MPLIACPDCRELVSDAAPACIGCGRPIRSDTKRVWVGRVVGAAIIAGAIVAAVAALVYVKDFALHCPAQGYGSGADSWWFVSNFSGACESGGLTPEQYVQHLASRNAPHDVEARYCLLETTQVRVVNYLEFEEATFYRTRDLCEGSFNRAGTSIARQVHWLSRSHAAAIAFFAIFLFALLVQFPIASAPIPDQATPEIRDGWATGGGWANLSHVDESPTKPRITIPYPVDVSTDRKISESASGTLSSDSEPTSASTCEATPEATDQPRKLSAGGWILAVAAVGMSAYVLVNGMVYVFDTPYAPPNISAQGVRHGQVAAPARLRAYPSTSTGEVLATLPAGEHLEIVHTDGEWHYVMRAGRSQERGFVHRSLVRVDGEASAPGMGAPSTKTQPVVSEADRLYVHQKVSLVLDELFAVALSADELRKFGDNLDEVVDACTEAAAVAKEVRTEPPPRGIAGVDKGEAFERILQTVGTVEMALTYCMREEWERFFDVAHRLSAR